MRVRRAGRRVFALPLVRPVLTGHGAIVSRTGFLVTLMDDEGRCGYGEAAPLPDFGTENLEDCAHSLDLGLRWLVESDSVSMGATLRRLAEIARVSPCARAAMESALCDIAAQQAGRSLAAWIRDREGISGDSEQRVRVQAVVVGEDPQSVAESAGASQSSGFQAFKLKVGADRRCAGHGLGSDLGLDVERVAALRSEVGAAAILRLDANEAWSLSEAETALAALARFDIDFVEQPVERSDLVGLRELELHGAIAIAADEALLGKGADACLEVRAASTFVVKPAALGGIEASLALYRRAQAQEVRVIWSSLMDGAVSRAGALAIASALGGGQIHGLGTAGLLERDHAPSESIADGTVLMNLNDGLGPRLLPVWNSPHQLGVDLHVYEAS